MERFFQFAGESNCSIISNAPNAASTIRVDFQCVKRFVISGIEGLIRVGTSNYGVYNCRRSYNVVLRIYRHPLTYILQFISVGDFHPSLALIRGPHRFVHAVLNANGGRR